VPPELLQTSFKYDSCQRTLYKQMKAGIEADKRRRGRPAGSDKTQFVLRVDNATLAAFRATWQGWQSRMN